MEYKTQFRKNEKTIAFAICWIGLAISGISLIIGIRTNFEYYGFWVLLVAILGTFFIPAGIFLNSSKKGKRDVDEISAIALWY